MWFNARRGTSSASNLSHLSSTASATPSSNKSAQTSNLASFYLKILSGYSQLVSKCFEPSQPQRITSGLNTNSSLSPSYSFHKSLYHRSFLSNQSSYSIQNFGTQNQKNNNMFWSLFIFREHSTRESASSRMTLFFCGPTQEPVLAAANPRQLGRGFGKNVGEWTRKVKLSKEEIPASRRNMHGNILTCSRL